jgi:hypothetical protein
MTRFVGLDVSQKMTAICVVDNAGHRLWRGQCPTNPEQISILVSRHAGDDARLGIETGAMTPWCMNCAISASKSFVSTPGMHALPLRCSSIRRIHEKAHRNGKCAPERRPQMVRT